MSTQQDSASPEWLSLSDDEKILWQDSPTLITETTTFVWAGFLTMTVLLAPVGLLIAGSSYLSVKNREYVMTTQKFYQKSGVLSTSTEESAVSNMQNMSYSQSFIGSMFDFGTIEIADASDSVTFRNVTDPEAVKQDLTELANAHATTTPQTQGRATGDTQQLPSADAEAIAEITDQLAAINAEFEQLHEQTDTAPTHSKETVPEPSRTVETDGGGDTDSDWNFST